MKIWKVDNYCAGDTREVQDVLEDGTLSPAYWRTPEMELANILNTYEKQGANVKEIISYTRGNYSIVYTVEDESIKYGIDNFRSYSV